MGINDIILVGKINFFGNKSQTKLHRDLCGNIDLKKVCCDLYYPHCCYDFHWIILSYTTLFIYWMLL